MNAETALNLMSQNLIENVNDEAIIRRLHLSRKNEKRQASGSCPFTSTQVFSYFNLLPSENKLPPTYVYYVLNKYVTSERMTKKKGNHLINPMRKGSFL